jgi:hypothetical protein
LGRLAVGGRAGAHASCSMTTAVTHILCCFCFHVGTCWLFPKTISSGRLKRKQCSTVAAAAAAVHSLQL